MDGINLTWLAIVLLGSVGVGGLVYLLVFPFLSGEKNTEKRVANYSIETSRNNRRMAKNNASDAHKKRQKVQATLDELEEKHRESEKVTLHTRIIRAGLTISNEQFYLYSFISAIVVTALTFMAVPSSYFIQLMAFFVGGLGLPRFYLNKRAKKRQKQFLAEFANAIDVIIRGIRSGLPLNDCMHIIATEIPEPVGSEFASLLDQIKIGVTLDQALARMYERIPVQEVNFFSIVLSIQAKTGGNLAESLGNLSQVLRERRKLVNKVIAFSQEAKSSAAIIGALPIMVMGLVYMATPSYIEMLFVHPTGQMLLAIAATMMTMGVLIMRKMINFDF